MKFIIKFTYSQVVEDTSMTLREAHEQSKCFGEALEKHMKSDDSFKYPEIENVKLEIIGAGSIFPPLQARFTLKCTITAPNTVQAKKIARQVALEIPNGYDFNTICNETPINSSITLNHWHAVGEGFEGAGTIKPEERNLW